MIKNEDVKSIAIKFLDANNIKYSTEGERIFNREKADIDYGKHEGTIKSIYVYSFGQLWGTVERSMFLYIDAENGDVLYILGPHGPVYIVEE